MEQDIALSLINDMLLVTALVVSPLLIISLLVGLLVSLIQVVTQIQEMTLTFVPKIVAAVVVVLIAGAWMLDILVGFTREIFQLASSL